MGRHGETPARPYIDREVALPTTVHNIGGLDAAAEITVIIRLLEDHTELVKRTELYETRPEIGAERLDAAILSLIEAQVICSEHGGVRCAAALQRLDALRLVAV
jgi:hypothetical protein